MIVTQYEGWGKSHNGRACIAHIAGEQHLLKNDFSNGRITSGKISDDELARQRRRLDEISASRKS